MIWLPLVMGCGGELSDDFRFVGAELFAAVGPVDTWFVLSGNAEGGCAPEASDAEIRVDGATLPREEPEVSATWRWVHDREAPCEEALAWRAPGTVSGNVEVREGDTSWNIYLPAGSPDSSTPTVACANTRALSETGGWERDCLDAACVAYSSTFTQFA